MKLIEDINQIGATIILPMHNEEKIIKKAIESLLDQTFKHIDIVCVLDNCTDNTESILQDCFSDNEKVKLFKSIKNKHKKAGALNQLLDHEFNNMKDYILVMDADTILARDAVAKGIKFLNNNKKHAAVCSMAGVLNTKHKNLLWHLQNIEYGLGDSSFIENKGNVFVCRGMYSMYSKRSLREVLKRGYIYDLESITEDYELTLELKRLGYQISSSTDIQAYTDVPLTLKEFWVQRVRWMKGGIEDLKKHGFKKYTRNDICGAVFYRIMILMQVLFLVEFALVRSINVPWLIGLSSICLLNTLIRGKYIRYKDKTTYTILFTIIPMMIYGLLDAVLTVYSTCLAMFNIKIKWR